MSKAMISEMRRHLLSEPNDMATRNELRDIYEDEGICPEVIRRLALCGVEALTQSEMYLILGQSFRSSNLAKFSFSIDPLGACLEDYAHRHDPGYFRPPLPTAFVASPGLEVLPIYDIGSNFIGVSVGCVLHAGGGMRVTLDTNLMVTAPTSSMCVYWLSVRYLPGVMSFIRTKRLPGLGFTPPAMSAAEFEAELVRWTSMFQLRYNFDTTETLFEAPAALATSLGLRPPPALRASETPMDSGFLPDTCRRSYSQEVVVRDTAGGYMRYPLYEYTKAYTVGACPGSEGLSVSLLAARPQGMFSGLFEALPSKAQAVIEGLTEYSAKELRLC